MMKKLTGIFFIIGILINLFMFSNNGFAQPANPFGQTLQIQTNFKHVCGKPTWLLIVRDCTTGIVSPYIFDVLHRNNFWVAFTWGHTYKVTVSNVKFDTNVEINNFCHLQGCVLSGISMLINVSGVLSADPCSSKCHVRHFRDMPFSIVSQ